MATIRLDGVIIPDGDHDAKTMAAIDRGECIDYAAFYARLMAAEATGEPVTVRINCLGGDTRAAAMMGIALEHLRAHLSVEVEAIAASAAANLIATLSAGVPVRVHRQSLIMYHGCEGMAFGGAGKLRDAASHADAYNSVVIKALKEKTTLPREVIDRWFSEGREGWLNAEEAVSCGLAAGIVDGDVERPAEFTAQGGQTQLVAMAAFAASIKERLMAKTAECKPKAAEETAPEVTLEERVKALEEENKALKAENEELKAKKAEGGMEIPTDAKKAEDGGEQTHQDTENEHLGELIKMLEEKVDAMGEEIKALKGVNARLTAGLKTPATEVKPNRDFIALVREIPADLPAREYAARFEALKKEHAAEYEAYVKAHQTR